MTRNAAVLLTWLTLIDGAAAGTVTSATSLADQPIFATANVPGNMAFALSVEFPTAISVANLDDYSATKTYGGYFDPAKCYQYVYSPGTAANNQYNAATSKNSYFQPAAFATGTGGHGCSGLWSGNFMNWATMQTIDPFRWALTGGYRSTDSTTQTILEKAWAANEGSVGNFPYRGVDQPTGNHIALSLVPTVTPFTNWPDMNVGIWANGNTMLIAAGSGYKASTFANNVYDLPSDVNSPAPTPGQAYSTAVPNTSTNVVTYRAYIRVSVCDTSILGVLGLESNCVGYGSPSTVGGNAVYPIYKPEGLIQKYSNQIKYAVFGYLDTVNTSVQGGVLREPMEFVGPTYPQPFSTTVITNPTAEWSAATGQMNGNPDPTTASASGVSQSGVMNYINKFGEYGATQYLAGNSNYVSNTNIYMTYDHVSEMYYAAIRYFENLGNVPQWLPQTVTYQPPSWELQTLAGSGEPAAVQLDGFPAVTTWTDPIAYSCQKNFILGIGDDHTQVDFNVAGSSVLGLNVAGHSPAPPAVTADTFNQSSTWTLALQALEGMSPGIWWDVGGSYSTYLISGLAYGAHVLDIRPDLTGTQTIATYWMDVEEGQEVENLNPFYLASKYGGFKVPTGYSITNTTPLPLGEYDTTGNTLVMNGNHVHPLPDNYFEAGNANAMVSSLTSAFNSIAIATQNTTTAFSVPNPNIASTGTLSFAASYNSTGSTGTLIGSKLTLPGGTPTLVQQWVSDTVLQSQLAGTGWQTARKVVTWSNGSSCGSTYAGAPFEAASLCSAQLSALTPTSYSPSTTSTQYLGYLRGDTTNQVGSTASGSTKSLRARTLFLGDIVDAGVTPVATPSMSYTESNNPGYAAFSAQWTTTSPRPTMVYVAANDGMLHGFLGSSGSEVFAYVPNALFQGPTGTPQVNGLAQLGNPGYSHRFYVDATALAFDVDLNHTYQSGSTTPNWHTVLIGGLGKGGTSFYAIDVTDPGNMQSATEAQIAQNVLWEFTDSTMGYSFAAPVVVKTAQYGWVVLLTSGYDNSDGYGYVYVVNPASGALLQKIRTPSPSSGLTQLAAYVQDYTDFTADSAYVGDLNGNVWRFDLTATTGAYPAPTLLAQLTDSQGNAQPVTSAPLIEVHPTTRKRYVLIGTGKLLASTDIATTNIQSFYGIIDGTAGSFNPSLTSPATRSNLTQVTDITVGVTIPAGSDGWYYDLAAGYRVASMPVAYNGIVAWSALLPAATNPCNPQGASNVFAVNYSSGLSVINSTTTGSTTPAPDEGFTNAVTNLKFFDNNGSPELIAGDTKGNMSQVSANLTSTLTTRLLNWREIPTAD